MFNHELLVLCEKACSHCAKEFAKHEHCRRCAEKYSQSAEACHAHHGEI